MKKEYSNQAAGTTDNEPPLSGYRVLNLADEKGALCGKILADLGADVIKIEPPQGDSARNKGPFFHNEPGNDRSLFWFAYYLNQRSITLNIETPPGMKILLELIKKSAFIIESFSPGYMQKLRIGYTTLSNLNPEIIMTSITPFGQEGPYKDWSGSDIVLSAMGMSMSLIGDSDRAPLRIGGAEQSYLVAGAFAAAGTMVAHYHRLLSGQGQHVDVSAQESVLFTTLGLYMFQEMEGYSLHRTGNYSPRWGKEERQVWECRDGYVMWVPFLSMQGRYTRNMVEWMDSEGQAGELKNINWEAIGYEEISIEDYERWKGIFGSFIKNHTKSDFEKEAIKRDLLIFPVNTPEELLHNTQLDSRNFWTSVRYPELNISITHPGALYRSSDEYPGHLRRAPLIGEHNLEIYRDELGLTDNEINQLKKDRII